MGLAVFNSIDEYDCHVLMASRAKGRLHSSLLSDLIDEVRRLNSEVGNKNGLIHKPGDEKCLRKRLLGEEKAGKL